MATTTGTTRELDYPEWHWFHVATKTTNPIACTVWLLVRLYLGWQWVDAAWGKITGDGWLNNGGAALKGYTQSAIDSASNDHAPVAYDWWVDVLQFISDNASWMAKIIPFVELTVGILMLVGLFTGVVAVIGLMLNFSFVLSGTAGVNPVFILLGLMLLAAWRNAGWYGLDRFVLPRIGVPDKPGTLFRDDGAAPVTPGDTA